MRSIILEIPGIEIPESIHTMKVFPPAIKTDQKSSTYQPIPTPRYHLGTDGCVYEEYEGQTRRMG